jgi:hypothetical protein
MSQKAQQLIVMNLFSPRRCESYCKCASLHTWERTPVPRSRKNKGGTISKLIRQGKKDRLTEHEEQLGFELDRTDGKSAPMETN